MNKAELRDTFEQVLKSMPKDIRIPKYQAENIINNFMDNVNESLQKITESIAEKANTDSGISNADRDLFAQQVTSLILPYIQSSSDIKDPI